MLQIVLHKQVYTVNERFLEIIFDSTEPTQFIVPIFCILFHKILFVQLCCFFLLSVLYARDWRENWFCLKEGAWQQKS